MCGIVGYVGFDPATPILLKGLEKLEYRGYDSAGVAVYDEKDGLRIEKAKGKLRVLCEKLHDGKDVNGTIGIGHTRWATHGAPSDINSHPQVSDHGKFAVVHNGIIENYLTLKEFLLGKGITFVSETDTEVIAQLLEYYYEGNIFSALVKVLQKLEGSYALGVICTDAPNELYAVRKDSPLIVGLGKGENFIASDVPAILSKTRDIYRLKDQEIVKLTRNQVEVLNMDGVRIEKEKVHIDWDVNAAEKGGYEHFMFKEIMEQPKALRDTISPRLRDGRIVLDDITLTREQVEKIRRICVVACGSAYHVGMVAKYTLEKLTRIPVEAEVASELRYRDPIIDKSTLVIVVSQSGETADTLAALREAKKRGARVLSIVNVVGSSIANESDDVIYTWAGPEIAVATTKAYSTQLAVVYMIAIYLADLLGKLSPEEYENYIQCLQKLPEQVEDALKDKESIQYFASKYFNAKDIFFIGRNLDYALSMEGSLKLKEISYIHSEAYAAGELKHGTISLIENGTLVVALATIDSLFEKIMSNVKEVKARGAYVLGVTTREHAAIQSEADYAFYVPKTCEMMQPSLAVIPLQLFAYYVAAMKGCDIDKPRNLAKSVTVE